MYIVFVVGSCTGPAASSEQCSMSKRSSGQRRTGCAAEIIVEEDEHDVGTGTTCNAYNCTTSLQVQAPSTASSKASSTFSFQKKRKLANDTITFSDDRTSTTTPTIPTAEIGVVDCGASEIDDETFFAEFVATRRPCILTNASGNIRLLPSPQLLVKDEGNETTTGCHLSTARTADADPPSPSTTGVYWTIPTVTAAVSAMYDARHKNVTVQVERRLSHKERFGRERSAQRQIVLPLHTFLNEQDCKCRTTNVPPPSDEKEKLVKVTTRLNNQDATNGNDKPASTWKDLCHYYLSTQDRNDTCDDSERSETDATGVLARTAIQEHNSSSNRSSHTNHSPINGDRRRSEDRPPRPFFGAPCRILLDSHYIPFHFPLAGRLVLHSCQLWMGNCSTTSSSEASINSVDARSHSSSSSTTSTHSGLHHDFHDNFYTVLAGRKEFILYPPEQAPFLALAGTIETIHPNGLISYTSHPTVADGRSATHVSFMNSPSKLGPSKHAFAFSADNDSHADDFETSVEIEVNDDNDDAESSDDDEEEVVLGYGFDYESDEGSKDYHNDKIDQAVFTKSLSTHSAHDDFDEVAGLDEEKLPGDEKITECASTGNLPDHFSWIDPVLDSREGIVATYPAFAKSQEIRIVLEAGQTLFLPASWLHCVISSTSNTTSNGDDCDTSQSDVTVPSSIHMAVNYWYHPPDNLTNFHHPYNDRNYWENAAE